MKEVPILLVANKIDLRNAPGAHENVSSFVSKKEGENLAEVLYILYANLLFLIIIH